MPAVHWGLGERIMSDPKRKFPVCEWDGRRPTQSGHLLRL